MHDDHNEPLERRPSFGRDEYYAEARRSFERFKAAARQGTKRRLTVAEARRRAARHRL
jgi:hypothetical protein